MLSDAQWAQVAEQLAAIRAAEQQRLQSRRATRRAQEPCIFDHTPPKGRSHPHWSRLSPS